MGVKGEQVGPFVLDRKLSNCPEGTVWKARSEDRTPVLLRLYTDPFWIQAVRSEGVPTGGSEHPNLSQLLAADLDAPRPFLAWTFSEGATVRDLTVACPYFPLGAALPFAIQLVRGLEALHAAGIAHHDLRPETVWLDTRGRVLLAGPQTEGYRRKVLERLEDKEVRFPEPLARSLRDHRPPEQRKGRIDGVAGDVYQLGVLLYRILCGEAPDPFELRYPSQRDKRIPKILDEVVFSALERRTRARLASAVGLEERLVEGFERAGFVLDLNGDPSGWMRYTPWERHPTHLGGAPAAPPGGESQAFIRLFKR
jgi:serine/threonine protein kinase